MTSSTHPDAEFAKRRGKIEEFRPYLAALPGARRVFHIDAIGRGVLGNDQKFLDARGDQLFRLAQHVGGRPRHQIAAQFRDDAEAAAVITAL